MFAIRKIEGRMKHEYFEPHLPRHFQPGGPTWLRELIGDRWFEGLDRVVAIRITGDQIDQAAEFSALRVLHVDLNGESPRLTPLEQCGELEVLEFDGYRPVKQLRVPRLPRLRALHIATARSVEIPPGNLPALEVLHVRHLEVGDDLLTWVPSLTRLREASVTSSNVTDGALAELAKLPDLVYLDLSNTMVHDRGVLSLVQSKGLRELRLDENKISDRSLVALRQMTNLKKLSLVSTDLSADGITELSRVLPKCVIVQ